MARGRGEYSDRAEPSLATVSVGRVPAPFVDGMVSSCGITVVPTYQAVVIFSPSTPVGVKCFSLTGMCVPPCGRPTGTNPT